MDLEKGLLSQSVLSIYFGNAKLKIKAYVVMRI